jgi:hypothetical protein
MARRGGSGIEDRDNHWHASGRLGTLRRRQLKRERHRAERIPEASDPAIDTTNPTRQSGEVGAAERGEDLLTAALHVRACWSNKGRCGRETL